MGGTFEFLLFLQNVDSFCWIRDVFWLGPGAPLVLGEKHISNQEFGNILILDACMICGGY